MRVHEKYSNNVLREEQDRIGTGIAIVSRIETKRVSKQTLHSEADSRRQNKCSVKRIWKEFSNTFVTGVGCLSHGQSNTRDGRLGNTAYAIEFELLPNYSTTHETLPL
ncbi:hypothetical protein EVAR_27425_1 [Eumeta japonica]|uniref:Uncharacterized protein n=1 Tax=Eumeta variegata TaxID=151549 RepID=A0A4C1VL94_EUMVA|nr:hypothetical protein EVAR_27425_1 [Eumeta japonica]